MIRRHRPGFSLIELMLVITSSGVMMAVCLATMHALMRVERANREGVSFATTLGRLHSVFRDDVRAASRAKFSEGKDRVLILSLVDGREITYRPEGSSLLRTEKVNGDVDRIERFRFRASLAIEPMVREQGGMKVVELRLVESAGHSALSDVRLEAFLGRNQRFHRSGEKQP